MQPNTVGVIMLDGNSEKIFAQKYELTEYMLLFASLKKMGLSSGKIRMTV